MTTPSLRNVSRWSGVRKEPTLKEYFYIQNQPIPIKTKPIKSNHKQSNKNPITTNPNNPMKIKSKSNQNRPYLHVFSWKLRSLNLNNNNRTYFRLEEAPEAELSNTASEVVPANTLAPIRAAKPVARKAPICLIEEKNKKTKKVKFPPKESKCLNQ